MPTLPNFRVGDAAPEDDFSKDLEKNLDSFLTLVRTILNGGLRFADNFDCHIETITTSATPGVETAITHGLKRTPTGCFALEKDKAAHIYKGASGKSETTYNVASDVASVTATLIIF